MTVFKQINLLPCVAAIVLAAFPIAITGCKSKADNDKGPKPAPVVTAGDMALVSVDHPELFPLVKAEAHDAAGVLDAVGTVQPDINREIPVISLASGRVVDIKAKLGDTVRKGQLLLKVQSPDSTNAFDTYLKAVNDERMYNKTYARAEDLYAHGAIALAALEQAEDAEKDAQADLKAAEEQLHTLGLDPHHPSPIVNVYSPINGVIVQQNVTNAAAAGVTYSGSATTFTVADLTSVWVVCDVYENDIPKLALGQEAKIRLTAYPEKSLTGRITDIGPVLDPTIRTAKVRVELVNPGLRMKVGMFVNATFTSREKKHYALVPAPAILHLHDREWVFVPAGNNQFRRVEVKAGDMVGDRQVVLSGIASGQQVVSNVLQLETTLENQ